MTATQPVRLRPVTPTTILAQKLEHLIEAADSAGVDRAWRSDLREAGELAGGLDSYVQRWSTPESSALRNLTERTRAEDWRRHPGAGRPGALEPEMLSGPVEGQLLKMLVHATRATRVLEIGLFTGYSALAMAEALPESGRLTACEIDAGVARFAQRSFDASRDGHKIEIRVGAASETLSTLATAGEVFDLIFIDADKAGYRNYLNTLLDANLLAPHGLIAVDNTLMQGQPWTSGEATSNGQAIADFNQAVANDQRVEQVIVPLRDGLTLIRRVDAMVRPAPIVKEE
jgi:caffeoyl-CoA O-methyltransferase